MLKKVKTKEKKRGQYIKRKADKAIAEQLTIDNLCVWKGFCLSAVFVCCCSYSGREILRSWFLSHTAAVIKCSRHPNQRNYNWGILYPAATFRCVSACENVEDRRNALGIWCRSFHLCDAKKVILKPYQKMEKQYTRNNIPNQIIIIIYFFSCLSPLWSKTWQVMRQDTFGAFLCYVRSVSDILYEREVRFSCHCERSRSQCWWYAKVCLPNTGKWKYVSIAI